MSTDQFFYFNRGIPQGPFNWKKFVELAQEGTIKPNTQVFRNDEPSCKAFELFGDNWEHLGVPLLNRFGLFLLGGFTYYAVVCLFCGIWMWSLPPNSENWGPAVIMVLGSYGIPLFGGVVALLRRQLSHDWLTSRIMWVTVLIDLCICLLTYAYAHFLF